MKVTVCITTYNLERYIAQALESVLAQNTDFQYEIIVGDDCSTDGTRDILHRYQKDHPDKIRLILHKTNIGVNKNDYSLINEAKGEYIAWLDGDDYWTDTDKLSKQVRILDSHKEFSCVHTGWQDYIENKNIRKGIHIKQQTWERESSGTEHVRKILLKQSSGVRYSSILFRKHIVQNFINSDSSAFTAVPHLQNDLNIFLILAENGPFYYLDDITTVYRIRTESLSMTTNISRRTKYIYSYIKLMTYWLTRHPLSKKDIYHVLHDSINTLLVYYIRHPNNGITFSSIKEVWSEIKALGYTPTFMEEIIIKTANHKSGRLFCSSLISINQKNHKYTK